MNKNNSKMIVVINYGMGNLLNVEKALHKIGCRTKVTDEPRAIRQAAGAVLPGVGSFKDCMRNLTEKKIADSIYDFISSGRPFLGICLGMQVLFTESEEFGTSKGLDVLKGKVVLFNKNAGLKIPHMGWNRAKIHKNVPMIQGISDNSYFYFVHSYYVVPESKDEVVTTTDYGVEFASSVGKDNIFACQFHPEKSQKIGLKLLQNFKKAVYNAG